MAREWTKGMETINLALDLGDDVTAHLPPPEAGSVKTLASSLREGTKKVEVVKRIVNEEPITFRSVVEEWCEEQGLLFIPLKEADLGSGLPLFRLTARGDGKGGVVVYLKGDVMYARDAGKKDGAVFRPVGLDERLLLRLEAK
ncbi:MAG: hypothetical protein Q9174_006153 [Haloplaca sp. 1 TL-2023]